MAPVAPLPRLITSIPPGTRQNKRTLLVLGTVLALAGVGGIVVKFGGKRPALSREPRDRPVSEQVITETRTAAARRLTVALHLCPAGPAPRARPGPDADGAAGADARRPAGRLSAVEQWLCASRRGRSP